MAGAELWTNHTSLPAVRAVCVHSQPDGEQGQCVFALQSLLTLVKILCHFQKRLDKL